MRLPSLPSVLALTGLMMLPCAAFAQATSPPPAATSPAGDRARALHAQATSLYAERRYEEALPLFEAAHRGEDAGWTAAALGACEIQLGRYAEAAGHLARALRDDPEDADAAERQRTTAMFEQARARVGTVVVTVNRSGAVVFADERMLGTSPLDPQVFVDPGPVAFTAKLAFHREATAKADVAAGATSSVSLQLVPEVSAGPDAARREGPSLLPAAVVAGAGIVAGGIGFGLLAAGAGKGSDADAVLADVRADAGDHDVCSLDERPSACASLKEMREDHDRLVNAGTVAMGIGGAAVLGAAVYALWASVDGYGPTGRASGAVTWTPVAGPAGGGVWLQGAF